MSDYVYESGLSTKRRRQRRTAVTLLLTLLFLFGAFWWAWSYIRDNGEGAGATPTGTAGSCEGVADPRDVTVNVYNATSINGLAGRVSEELTERGFTIGEVGNDPLGADIAPPAELRYGDEGRPYAGIMKTIVEAPSLRPDGRADNTLDFVLGTGYNQLLPPPAGLPTC